MRRRSAPTTAHRCWLASGGALVLLGVERAQGRRLDQDVQDLVAAFGNAFLVLLGIWLVCRDLDTLGSHLFHPPPPALHPPAAPADLPPLAALPPLH